MSTRKIIRDQQEKDFQQEVQQEKVRGETQASNSNIREENTIITSPMSAPSTLQQAKQRIAYPRGMERKKQCTNKTGDSSTLGVGSHAVVTGRGATPFRGLGKNRGPIPYHKDTEDAPAQEYFEDESSLPKKKGGEDNPSYISYLDESLPSKENPSYISYLDETLPSNNDNPLPVGLEPMTPTDNLAPSSNNNLLLPAVIEPMPMPTPISDHVVPQHGPGAYAQVPGANLQRLDQLNFSLIGVQPELLGQATMMQQQHDGDDSDRDQGLELVEQGERQLPNLDRSSNHVALVRASTVGSASFFNSSTRMRAQPVNQEKLDEHAAREAKERNHKRIACVIVALACLVLIVSLAVRLTKKNDSTNTVLYNKTPSPSQPTIAPSFAPSRPLPPMENLELLYAELPEKTKQSLYNSSSPQYQAWEWLLNHPNITTYPKWRKKQIFAMSTFFLALEGRSWPEGTPGIDRWMNVSISECSWALTDAEEQYWGEASVIHLGADAYEPQAFQACNENGEIQTLWLHKLQLSWKIVFPPEIGMLTSLKILGIGWSQINATLSDLLLPELIQLPGLSGVNFQNSGVSGTIPQMVSLLTNVRHLLLGSNNLVGSLPSEVANMSSLEYLNIDNMKGITGVLPSELGLMTSLTGLEIDRSSFSGRIPSHLGQIDNMRWLALFENGLTGALPTEIGLLTNTKRLRIWNNALTGSVPSELGLMTNIVDCRLGNDLTQKGPRNNFSGFLPTELWGLSHLEYLHLLNLPHLHGRVPSEIMMPNLTMLSLSGSPHITGIIPDQVCLFVEELDFDCSDLLCGCDCLCGGRANRTNLHT